MTSKLTVTEAETLAVMFDSAARKIATARDSRGAHVWSYTIDTEVISDMFRGFYDIAPYGVFI
jgi:hypothetical protein